MKSPAISNKISPRLQSNQSGVTSLEILLVLSIFAIILGGIAPILGRLQTQSQSVGALSTTMQYLRLARTRAYAGHGDTAHGAYLEINPSDIDRLILFRGSSYATRDAAYDYAIKLPKPIEVSTTLSGNEVVFSQGTALPNVSGSSDTITLIHSSEGGRTITIYANGLIESN